MYGKIKGFSCKNWSREVQIISSYNKDMSAFRRSEYMDQQGSNLCLEMTVEQDGFETEHSITH